eukprot:4173363-Pyramimonas_sp.AAC.2
MDIDPGPQGYGMVQGRCAPGSALARVERGSVGVGGRLGPMWPIWHKRRVAYALPSITAIVWGLSEHSIPPEGEKGTSIRSSVSRCESIMRYHHPAYRLHARQLNVLERCRASTAPTGVSLHRNSPYQLVKPCCRKSRKSVLLASFALGRLSLLDI